MALYPPEKPMIVTMDDVNRSYQRGYRNGLKDSIRKPLTREVIDRDFHGRVDFVRQVEAAHGIKE